MQYALLFYTADDVFETMQAAAREAWFADMNAWRQSLVDAGVFQTGQRLASTRASTSLRHAGGELLITDGPFAETKEVLAGFVLLEAADLDAALGWARRCPITRLGAVEVRPGHAGPR
jgi:hypothetical protein